MHLLVGVYQSINIMRPWVKFRENDKGSEFRSIQNPFTVSVCIILIDGSSQIP